jgi:transcriptional regulator with XRE-family HTH domain
MLRLLKQTRLTQKEMARKLGVAPASMTDYCKGRRLPNMEFFVALKEQFGISIDEFVTKDLTPSDTLVPPKAQVFDQQLLETYKKYCCSQFLYYFDTSKTKGRDIQAPRDSVLYGILYIYENPDSTEVPEFKCAAILGIDDRDEVSRLKSKLDKMKDPGKILEYISSNYESAAYYGDFTLSQLYGFVSISHANTDKALLIFHRVDNNKPEIIGGIGTINSVSKGREHVPVVQFIGMSKYPLSMSVEEIHYNLLLDYPSFEADQEMVDEMITNFKALYADPDGAICKGFSDYEKAIMVKSTLDKYVRTALTRNMFRYGKITGTTDDDQWYHAIKKTSIKNSQH